MNNHQQKEKGRPPPVACRTRRDGQKFPKLRVRVGSEAQKF